ncbi:MAG: Enoyl-CoA hydratase [isoleucine degradation] / 3-hydroxyacyl-CoA dehydrogenase / 3-hydroxybutyryl-CoA epimerase, partial [uncultured Blastococcus sp.]
EQHHPLGAGRRRRRRPHPRRPLVVGEHHERRVRAVDGRDRRPAGAGEGVGPRRRPDECEEDLLRRWQPRQPDPGDPREPGRRTGPGHSGQGAAAPPGDARDPDRLRHQRRGPRRRSGDRPGHAPPRRPRRPEGQARLSRGHLGAAARGRRHRPLGAAARPDDGAAGAAAAGAAAASGEGAEARFGARAGRRPRRAARQGPRLGAGERDRAAALRPQGLQGARRHPVVAVPGVEPAGLPGQPDQAAQGRALPGAVLDPVGGGGEPAGRRGHGVRRGGPLLRRPRGRPDVDQHDPGAVVRPERRQRRRVPARGGRDVHRDEGRRARRRDDGRGHRARLRQGRRRRGAQGREPRGRREGQGARRRAGRQAGLPWPHDPGVGRRVPGADHPDRRRRRPRRVRRRRRGGLRGPGAQAPRARRGGGERPAGRPAGVEHEHAADRRPGRGRPAAGRRGGHALLLAGGQDAAGRADRGGADVGRRPRPRLRHRAADREDTDRRPGQPRVLHQPRLRHAGARGRGAAGRGSGPDEHRAGGAAGRVPGRSADPPRRGHPDPAAEDPRRGGQGRRDRRPSRRRGAARAGRAGPHRQVLRHRVLRLGAGEADLAGARRAVPEPRGRPVRRRPGAPAVRHGRGDR